MRHHDPAAEAGVHQGFAELRLDGLAVDDEAATVTHDAMTYLFDAGARSILQVDADRTGVARLSVVEHRDPHVERAAGDEVLVVLAAGRKIAARDERPMAVLPPRRSGHVVAVSAVLTNDQHPGNDGADRNLRIHFRRIG